MWRVSVRPGVVRANSEIGPERFLCAGSCLRKLPSVPLRRRTSSSNTVTVQWQRPSPGAPVSLIAHLTPHPGSTISSALGLSFRHCPHVPASCRWHRSRANCLSPSTQPSGTSTVTLLSRSGRGDREGPRSRIERAAERASADEARHQSSRRSNQAETARRSCHRQHRPLRQSGRK